MATWPASLPQTPRLTDYEESFRDPVLRTDMQGGEEKTRLLYSAVPRDITMSFVLDQAQMDTFESFWENDINFGATRFTWKLPKDESNGRIFRFNEPYRKTVLSCDTYILQISVELLPNAA